MAHESNREPHHVDYMASALVNWVVGGLNNKVVKQRNKAAEATL